MTEFEIIQWHDARKEKPNEFHTVIICGHEEWENELFPPSYFIDWAIYKPEEANQNIYNVDGFEFTNDWYEGQKIEIWAWTYPPKNPFTD